MTARQIKRVKFTMEIIRTICPVLMVVLQIAIITGLVIINN